MNLTCAFDIVEFGSKGKIVVALRDVKAGETIVVENEPLSYFTKDFKEKFEGEYFAKLSLASYKTLTSDLSKEVKFLTLYGPSTAEHFRNFAKEILVNCPDFPRSSDDTQGPRFLTSEEIEDFVRVANIVRLNMFSVNDDFGVYLDVTRFSHSCASNVRYSGHCSCQPEHCHWRRVDHLLRR
jgi:hypothetical protein